MSIVVQFLLFAMTHSPMDLVCAIELGQLKNMVNKKAIFCFRVPRGIIKDESCRCALNFRFCSTVGRSARGREEGGHTKKRKETKRKRHPRRRPQSSSYWFIGITECSARPDPARPGIACCNVDFEGMEAGLGASRCSWDGFGVPPRPLVIHEASLRN